MDLFECDLHVLVEFFHEFIRVPVDDNDINNLLVTLHTHEFCPNQPLVFIMCNVCGSLSYHLILYFPLRTDVDLDSGKFRFARPAVQ